MLPNAVPVTLALADAAGAGGEGPRALSSSGGFVVGLNLVWMAAVTAFMIAEKALSGGRAVTRVAGLLLVAWGAGMMSGALLD